jgi:glycerophosphoryl diester phosphodiesterase
MRTFILLLVLLVSPGIRPPSQEHAVLIGHRGNAAEAPENTLASIRAALALERPPEFVEVDVHASADGRLVVIHDSTLERTTTGAGAVAELTWDEIREHRAPHADSFGEEFTDEPIPLLEDVLAAVADSDTRVMIEIKAGGLGDDVVRLLERRGELGRHVVASFRADVVVAATMASAEVRTLYLTGEATPEQIELAHRIGADVFGVSQNGLGQEVVDLAHAKELVVWSWTVNEEMRASELLEWGVDGIITDRPRAMREVDGLR